MVEGKLRKLSQVSAGFITAINTQIAKLTTATFTVQEVTSDVTSDKAIKIKPITGNKPAELELEPKGTSGTSILTIKDADDDTDFEYLQFASDSTEMDIVSSKAGAGTAAPLKLIVGALEWIFGTTGSLTLPGKVVNTAIADLSAAAGQLWLSSTNVDNLKYSSATTIYTVHSTKGAVATNTAAAPTATASATAVMMACGGAITPLNTGRVHITISGQLANDTINDGATVDLRYGTGTAPINGAAVTGTLVGVAQTQTSLVGAAKSGFCISGVVTGLTLGTAIWIDASLLRVTGGNASITGVTISAFEV